MAHSDGTPRYGSGTPRTPTTPTFEQLLQAGDDGSRWSGMNSPTYNREHEMEDHGHDYPRKSVLAKVKERARRWRQNLGKKKGVDQDNGTPSWGVSLEEDDYGEEDAVYLGAPMYESELAPEDCKENARQHPRANPVISEKHILPNSPRLEDPLHINSCTSPNKTMAASRSSPNHDNASMMQGLSIGARQGAAAGGRANPNHDNASMMKGLSIGARQGAAAGGRANPNHDNASMMKDLSIGARQGAAAGGLADPNHDNASMMHGPSIGARQGAAAGGRSDISVPRQNPASPRQNTWDKGISVREYLSHKLEPGEDDRALSQVITDAMSPRKARANGNNPNNNVGIVEKVKDAVSSFLHAGESSSSSNDYPITRRAPISNTAPEIVEEENHGRILQTN